MTDSPAPALDVPPPSLATGGPTQTALVLWFTIGFLNLLSQVFLSRELAPAEFGTVNTVLGLVTILAAPLLGLQWALGRHFGADEHREHRRRLLEAAAVIWGGVSLLFLFVTSPLLNLPRQPLQFFSILLAGAAFLGITSSALTTPRTWIALLVAAAVVRCVVSGVLGYFAPWAQSGLGAAILAGGVLGAPALRAPAHRISYVQAWTLLRDRGVLLPLGTAVGIALALALFSNADRTLAQACFAAHAGLNFVGNDTFDNYQAAGLLGRAVVWSALPLLLILHAQRWNLSRSSRASLRYLWVYFAALCAGDFLYVALAPFLSWIFEGDYGLEPLIPGFAGAMFMIGLVQGVAVFALASLRYLECFLIVACSFGYTLLLSFAGHLPQLMIASMFWGALITLAFVLFIGVIRYARSHP